MVYLFVALASLFSRSMNCVVTAWKMSTASHAYIVIVIRVPTHLKNQGKSGNFFGQGKSGNFVGSQGKLAMIIHVAQVLSSVVVTDQLRHTRSLVLIQSVHSFSYCAGVSKNNGDGKESVQGRRSRLQIT